MEDPTPVGVALFSDGKHVIYVYDVDMCMIYMSEWFLWQRIFSF